MKNRDLIELLQRHDPDLETGVETAKIEDFNGRKRLVLGARLEHPKLREWDSGGGRLNDNELVHR